MEQLELRGLLCRIDGPSVVDPQLVAMCKTYREAVKLCWDKRKVKNMTQALLAERAGLYASHVSCYLRDGKRQRDLPAEGIRGFEKACDNTAISQWFALNAKLTPVEEMQFMRRVA